MSFEWILERGDSSLPCYGLSYFWPSHVAAILCVHVVYRYGCSYSNCNKGEQNYRYGCRKPKVIPVHYSILFCELYILFYLSIFDLLSYLMIDKYCK